MKAETILNKHWRNFRNELGLTYEDMGDKAKAHLLTAMDEYALQQANGINASDSNCTICGVSTRFLSKDDALGYVNRTDFRFIRGDDFINRLTDAQFIKLANLLDEMD